MELTSINKLRIAAVAALGIVVLGLLAWPLAAPADPLSPVRAWSISPSGTLALLVLAFGLGFVGYFIAWPHGREIGILAVPFGLTIWAGRSGPMRVLTQACRQPYEREALAFSLRFEPVYWLLVVAAGFAGVLLAQYLRAPSPQPADEAPTGDRHSTNMYLTGVIALAGTVLISNFLLGVFAQDVATSRNITPTQPPAGQIIFAVVAAFAVASFLVKKFANLSYLWPALASAFVIGFAQAFYDGAQVLRQFAETRPATSFPHSALAILPIQLVALGTLGSVLGYWLAVRYDWWRKHESAG
jgi:hypothetical protein